MLEPTVLADIRQFASWIAVVGTCLLAAFFFCFLIYHSLKKTSSEGSWFLRVIERHYAATIATPLAGISAVCIVLILEATSGPIEFEALGFRFKGASGPVVLWIFCFLAFIMAVNMLWNKDTRND